MSRWKHQSADQFARRPQARDDTATGGEDAAFSIDVLANDRGGRARSLYSVDQDNPSHALTSTTLASGATISIVDGQILYDPGSAFQFLDAGETATDTFTYAIRLGKGAISTATVKVTIQGADDQTGPSVERVSVSSAGEQANSFSADPSISADGRFVAYWSFASNLVEGDTNNTSDIFVFDRETGTTSSWPPLRVSCSCDAPQ